MHACMQTVCDLVCHWSVTVSLSHRSAASLEPAKASTHTSSCGSLQYARAVERARPAGCRASPRASSLVPIRIQATLFQMGNVHIGLHSIPRAAWVCVASVLVMLACLVVATPSPRITVFCSRMWPSFVSTAVCLTLFSLVFHRCIWPAVKLSLLTEMRDPHQVLPHEPQSQSRTFQFHCAK